MYHQIFLWNNKKHKKSLHFIYFWKIQHKQFEMELKEKEKEIEKELHYYEVWSGNISFVTMKIKF